MNVYLCLLPLIVVAAALSWIALLGSLDKHAEYTVRQKGKRGYLSWMVHEAIRVLKRELSVKGW